MTKLVHFCEDWRQELDKKFKRRANDTGKEKFIVP